MHGAREVNIYGEQHKFKPAYQHERSGLGSSIISRAYPRFGDNIPERKSPSWLIKSLKIIYPDISDVSNLNIGAAMQAAQQPNAYLLSGFAALPDYSRRYWVHTRAYSKTKIRGQNFEQIVQCEK